jgi:tryptophan-rich sensory protein
MEDTQKDPWSLVGFIMLCLFIGFMGGLYTIVSISDWYPEVKSPAGTPSILLFTFVWAVLYTLLGISAWLIYKEPPSIYRSLAFCFFGFQLFFNLLWPLLLFVLQSPLLGLIDLFTLLIFMAATAILFWKINPLAGIFFIPYFLWYIYELNLNFETWLINR